MTTVLLPISLLYRRPTSSSLPTHNFSNSIFSNSSTNKKTILFGINPSDSRPDNPLFLDENNALVDDMDGYLNNLSLEYESVWDTKPSWYAFLSSLQFYIFLLNLTYLSCFSFRCQPWTITLTGVSVISISWLIFNSIFLTSAISLLILAWWYIFLYSYPKVCLLSSSTLYFTNWIFIFRVIIKGLSGLYALNLAA